MKFYTISISLIALFAFTSCGNKKVATETKETSKKFPNEKIEEGFNLSAEYCVKCHKLKVVDDYSREQWDKILPNMARKAKITPEQEAAINEYINWELAN